MRIRVHHDAAAMAEAAADDIAGWLAVDADQTIGLAGGTTPRLTYELLARRPIQWERVQAWMTDERHVSDDHPDSNAGMARRALFDWVPATLHGVPFEDDPAQSASAYEATLRRVLGRGPVARPGLIVLGVGVDGHTASLFPGSEALTEASRDFVANWVKASAVWRLTATLPLLARARRTLFLVTGEAKAPVVAEILEGGGRNYPAAVVSHLARDPVWLLDRAAASSLTHTNSF